MRNNYMTDEKKEIISQNFGRFQETGEKKKSYYMDEAEYRMLEMHFEMLDKMNRIVAMIEYANPKKKKEFQKWLSDNFVSDK